MGEMLKKEKRDLQFPEIAKPKITGNVSKILVNKRNSKKMKTENSKFKKGKNGSLHNKLHRL